MVKSVEGIYRNGKVELAEPLAEAEGSRVIVTWMSPSQEIHLLEGRGSLMRFEVICRKGECNSGT